MASQLVSVCVCMGGWVGVCLCGCVLCVHVHSVCVWVCMVWVCSAQLMLMFTAALLFRTRVCN